MLTKFLNYHLTCSICRIKCLVSVRLKSSVGMNMKLLNDKKQFHKALQLFDQCKEQNTGALSSLTVTQALKACAHTGDLRRGLEIHQAIASRTENDDYILASLIHMYSKLIDELWLLLFGSTQCNVVILFMLNHYSTKRRKRRFQYTEQ